MSLNPLPHHYAMENLVSVYDEEAMTPLVLAGRTAAKVNETVAAFNKLDAVTTQLLATQDKDIAQKFNTMTDETIPQAVVDGVLAHIQSGDFDQAINLYMKHLNERVDNLLGTVTAGTTTMDAEIIDGRVHYTGEESPNLGTAIRTQIASLANQIGNVTLEWTAGYINARGGVYDNNACSCTQFVPVIPGTKYLLRTCIGDNMHVAYYNNVQGFISGFMGDATSWGKNALSDYELTMPENAYYIRITCKNTLLSTAGLYIQDMADAILSLLKTITQQTTVQLESKRIDTGRYAHDTGKLVVHESWDTLVYDVSQLNKATLTHTAIFADKAVGYFTNKYGDFIHNFNSQVVEVPVGAYTMYLSNQVAKQDTANVTVWYNMNEKLYDQGSENIQYTLGMGNTLCIGDSLTSGAYYASNLFDGASIDQNYPRYLGKIIQANVVNAGKSGYSASDWWLNMVGKYNYTDFDSVIIWLGTNNGLTDTLAEDVLAHTRHEDYATTETGFYCKIIERIKEANPDAFIVLCTVFASGGNVDTTNQVIHQIAEKYDCCVVDMAGLGSANMPELHGGMTNPHFGKAGNIYLANHINNSINQYFKAQPLALEFGLTHRTN